ncbi:hypothetical protein ACC756_06100 [Rhizobium ruizarguesonis]
MKMLGTQALGSVDAAIRKRRSTRLDVVDTTADIRNGDLAFIDERGDRHADIE